MSALVASEFAPWASLPDGWAEVVSGLYGPTFWEAWRSTLRDARREFRYRCNADPEELVVSEATAYVLADQPEVKDILRYVDPDRLHWTGLPEWLFGMRVVTPK